MPARLGQSQDRPLERLVVHRPELVEKRIDPDRLDQHRREQERDREDRRVKPPPARTPSQKEIGNPRQGRSRRPSSTPRLISEFLRPPAERLVRKPVGVQTNEALVERQGQIDHENDRQVHDYIEADGEKPVAAQPLRQVPEPCREARKRQAAGKSIAQRLVDNPEPVAAAIKLQCQRARLGNGDGLDSSAVADWRRARGRAAFEAPGRPWRRAIAEAVTATRASPMASTIARYRRRFHSVRRCIESFRDAGASHSI